MMKELIHEKLPSGKELVKEGFEEAKNIEIGRTLFMEEYSVNSEYEYKMKAKKERRIMFHAHFGQNTWEKTVEGLKLIYRELTVKRGFRVDRYGLNLNCVMGLPPELRDKVPKTTGPILRDGKNWLEIGQVVPIQPHLGDHMIGSPASVTNTKLALKAGVTTIGNLSQFFTFEYPFFTDYERAVETVKALGIMAALKNKGALVHSYLDDGYGARFKDLVSVAGWAMLEKYVIEDLIGARLAHCFGGLTFDYMKRMAFIVVLDKIHGPECVGSMIYGDTITLTENLEENLMKTVGCSLCDMIMQIKNPTGHAIVPVPFTEPIRIPSPEEIIQTHATVNYIKEKAEALSELIDYDRIYKMAEYILENAKIFYNNIMKGLTELGVDVRDPLQILLVLRRLGAQKIESLWGVAKEPIVPTDPFKLFAIEKLEEEKRKLEKKSLLRTSCLKNFKILLASTDVHEYALYILNNILVSFGADVINLGPSVENPEEIALKCQDRNPDAVVLTTHNAKALEYAQLLKHYFTKYNIKVPIIMGGKLQQNIGGALPVDVTEDIKNLGIIPCNDIENLINYLSSLRKSGENHEV